MRRPPSGSMCYWRVKGTHSYRFGYCTYLNSSHLVRMGSYNGDTMGGYVVSTNEIEWEPYQ